jgi:hypothetical protein
MRSARAMHPWWMLVVAMLAMISLASGATAQPVRKPQFELEGLVKLDGDDSYALLKEPEITGGVSVLVRQGESIGSYRLVAVEDDRVLLESPDREIMTVMLGGAPGSPGAVVSEPPLASQPEASLAPPAAPAPPSTPVPVADTDAAPLGPGMTAEQSVDAALKGTQGGKVLDMIKKALGLRTHP